jgi:hypothetical protein
MCLFLINRSPLYRKAQFPGKETQDPSSPWEKREKLHNIHILPLGPDDDTGERGIVAPLHEIQ